MINVLASIRVKTGRLSEFLEIFKSNVSSVMGEKGCIEYIPTIDIDADLSPQNMDKNIVTVIEKWESLDALHDHLNSLHMMAYKKKVKDIVEDISIKVLKEV